MPSERTASERTLEAIYDYLLGPLHNSLLEIEMTLERIELALSKPLVCVNLNPEDLKDNGVER